MDYSKMTSSDGEAAGEYTGKFVYLLAAVYGIGLGLTCMNRWAVLLFCREEQYTLGNFGGIWEYWQAISCFFVGFMNLSVVLDPCGFGRGGRRAVALNSAFVYGVWGVQNIYYSAYRQDLFHQSMWLNAVGCTFTALAHLRTAAMM